MTLQTTAAALGHILLFLAVFFLARRSAWTAWLLFALLPAVLSAHWLDGSHHDIFEWVKLYSVIGGTCVLLATQHTRLYREHGAYLAIYMFLLLNIVEAVLLDLTSDRLWNLTNAAVGVVLIATLEGPRRMEVTGAHNDLRWQLSWTWIACYTCWNAAFVALSFSDAVIVHAALLLAPLVIAAFHGQTLWLQARAYTLTTYMMWYFTFPQAVEAALPGPAPHYTEGGSVLAACGLLLALRLLIVRARHSNPPRSG